MGDKLCDLKVHINGQHTFLLNQRTLCSFSARLKQMVKQEKKRRSLKGNGIISVIKIMDFPGGPDGFELISRFCYNNGRIPTPMSPSNICLLHCSAFLLKMTEDLSPSNLLTQTENFLDGLFYWTWDDILTALKSCEPFFSIADSSGLLPKLISSFVAKISDNSETPLTAATPFPYSPSSCSSPDTSGFRYSSSNKTTDSIRHPFAKEWWFDDLAILAPSIIEKVMRTLGAYGADNKNLILTRFLLHYLKRAGVRHRPECGGLADTAVCGVVLLGRAAFSCRGLFWVMRIVSGFGLSKECRQGLERVIGIVMDQATLDDLLVSPPPSSAGDEGVYDVSFVMRLVRVFVSGVEDGGVPLQRMKKVGSLIDKYLGEISPDQSLKVSKFLGLAESLPDSARDCFDGVYRSLDIYLESHPALSSEERTRLCRCLNYEKLTLEACKDLAANPRIPPGAAIHAMVSQQSKLIQNTSSPSDSMDSVKTPRGAAVRPGDEAESACSHEMSDENEELRVNLQKMQNRVMELKKVCMEMKCQMTKMVKGRAIISRTAHQTSRGKARLC